MEVLTESEKTMTETNVAEDFYREVRARVSDRRTVALVMESELIPVAGAGAPIVPPTYARQDKSDKAPNFAVSQGVTVPQKDANGWYQDLQMNEHDTGLRRDAQVIVDSVGAQSGRAESALVGDEVFQRPPGIFILGSQVEVDEDDQVTEVSSLEAQMASAFRMQISTWLAAHRQADAWIKFAGTPDGKQVWEGGLLPDGRCVKDLIVAASPQNGELLYSLFPNAALFGYWLSSGTAQRHRLPRAYSSQIVGYAATPIKSAATMLDDMGGLSSSSRVHTKGHRLEVGGKAKPAALGFGPVPAGDVEVRAFSCELILQRASISLAVLRQIKFASAQRQEAALAVLTLLGMLGNQLAAEDGFLRSGCALATQATKWGWREQGTAPGELRELAVPDVGTLRSAVRLAVEHAESLGLAFQEPIELEFSEAQKKLIAERVAAEDKKQGADDQ